MGQLIRGLMDIEYGSTEQYVLYVFLLIKAILMGLITAWIAKEKDKKESVWFAYGFLFGVIAQFVLWLISKDKYEEEESIWICEECETENTGEVCKNCSAPKSKIIV